MAKVLVVDDSLSVRTVVERALNEKRHQVLSAASGTEALAHIRRDEPDLVVCDVIMPDMDGYRICEIVRDHPRLARTPVLLMSGIVNGSVLARAAAVRSNDVIRKPFAADDLMRRIDGLLAGAAPTPDASPVTAPAPVAVPALAPPIAAPGVAFDERFAPIEDLKGLLAEIAAVSGVGLAALVDRDGFLIESAGDLVLEAEMTGALAAQLAESAGGVGRHLEQGSLSSMVLEYERGLLFLACAGSTAMVATVLADPAVLGKVRYQVKKALPDLARLL